MGATLSVTPRRLALAAFFLWFWATLSPWQKRRVVSMPATQARPEAPTSAAEALCSGKLSASLVVPGELSKATRDEMWALFARYYAEVARAKFESDLDEKDHVILLRDDGDGSVRGMSTLKVYELDVFGRRTCSVFSGDTVIDDAYWGQSALHWSFLSYLVRVKTQNPSTPVFWFLISKGYKTYLLLSRNFPSHYPRHDRATPPWEQALLDKLATERYGNAYDKHTGLLRFEQPDGRLCERIAPITDELMRHPDVRFFVEKNPDHARGNELCCIGRIDLAFVVYGALRLLRRPFRPRSRR
jgi:hypothetical protein